jgi:D-serine dehydratase
MNLPLLSLDLPTFEANCRAMLQLCEHAGVQIAPHAKTPMSPALAASLVRQGAWGASVADLRQAEVMLSHGLRRIVIANEIGGRAAAARLAALLDRHRDAEVYLFFDSQILIDALAAEWRKTPELPRLGLLLEVGCGRGGVHDHAQVVELVRASAAIGDQRLQLAGVAAYEGTVNRPPALAAEMNALLDDLFTRMKDALGAVRAVVGSEPLLLSAGGSTLFDVVIARAAPIVQADRNADLLLRSGACYFGDHGAMPERFASILARNLLPTKQLQCVAELRPALRLWAEALSVHDSVAICGFGLRDAGHDQGAPVPLRLWRYGKPLADISGHSAVAKVNDQHAFVDIAEIQINVGDVVEFGIRHPCTTIDKHQLLFGLGDDGTVREVFRTHFG